MAKVKEDTNSSKYVEYQMSKKFADEVLKCRKGPERNINAQEYLVRYVNKEFGLLKTCTKVIVI